MSSGAKPEKPARRKLADQVAERLIDMIQRQKFGVGDRLPAERDLVALLSVSRSSVREAIQKLSSVGLLEARQGGGTFIVKPVEAWLQKTVFSPLQVLLQKDPAYSHDILEVRYALESSAAYHAALRATEEDRDRIRTAFAATAKEHDLRNPLDSARADAAFHLSFVEATHNAVLRQLVSGLFELIQASIFESLHRLYSVPEKYESLVVQHRAIMDAVLAGDAPGAAQAARDHLDTVRSAIQRSEEDLARQRRAQVDIRLTDVVSRERKEI